ncbi:hypothetical protein [Actinokineospora inagensis]|uniref:hypothetical protein n=1 Tax=Actinokineospora inagensis TaxID=103730 RepID=UPI0004260002|nr:hypothetical protein [Actinokineospora inagensis]
MWSWSRVCLLYGARLRPEIDAADLLPPEPVTQAASVAPPGPAPLPTRGRVETPLVSQDLG